MKTMNCLFLVFLLSVVLALNAKDNVVVGGHQYQLGAGFGKIYSNCDLDNIYSEYNSSFSTLIGELRNRCTYKKPEVPTPEYKPKELNMSLYGLIDVETSSIMAVSLNSSFLEEKINKMDKSLLRLGSKSKSFTVMAVNSSTTDRYKPHEDLIKRGVASVDVEENLEARSWSDVSYYVLYYAAGEAVLKFIQEHTESGAVDSVVNAYEALGWYSAVAIGRCARLFADGLSWGYNNGGRNAYGAFGARGERNRPAILPTKRTYCPSGSPDFCYDYLAPTWKLDICTSLESPIGYDDEDQFYNWSNWFCDHTAQLSYWGTTALHLYWSLGNGDQTYWVASFEVRPDTNDPSILYQDCDDAPW